MTCIQAPTRHMTTSVHSAGKESATRRLDKRSSTCRDVSLTEGVVTPAHETAGCRQRTGMTIAGAETHDRRRRARLRSIACEHNTKADREGDRKHKPSKECGRGECGQFHGVFSNEVGWLLGGRGVVTS